jgi:hypothetical protein
MEGNSVVNICLIQPTKLQIPQRKGSCFTNNEQVLGPSGMHLKLSEYLLCAEHCIEHEDMQAQRLP